MSGGKPGTKKVLDVVFRLARLSITEALMRPGA
jgi:hypothetical protein